MPRNGKRTDTASSVLAPHDIGNSGVSRGPRLIVKHIRAGRDVFRRELHEGSPSDRMSYMVSQEPRNLVAPKCNSITARTSACLQ